MKSLRRFQPPVRVSLSFAKSRCASASTKVIAIVATGRRIAIGVLVSTMPARVSAATSTESKPTPCRAINFTRQSARPTVAAVTFGELM